MKKLFFLGILMILSGCLTPQSKNKKFTPEVAREQAFQAWNDTLPEILKKIVPPVFKDTVYLISDTLNFREKLNTTIQEASQNGGGVVKILPGTYFVKGPVRMKSDVNLKLSEGAQLVFSAHPDGKVHFVSITPHLFMLWEKKISLLPEKGVYTGRQLHFFTAGSKSKKMIKSDFVKWEMTRYPLKNAFLEKDIF